MPRLPTVVGRRVFHRKEVYMKHIDLHTHTRHSDGTATVKDLLQAANKSGISILSITDHNTVDAYAQLSKCRDAFSGRILCGVELATVHQNELIEILGYGIDVDSMQPLIAASYLSFREKQIREATLDVKALLRSGATLSDAFVKAMLDSPEQLFDPDHETCRPSLLRELQRYPENASFFESRAEFEQIDPNRFSRKYLFNPKSRIFSDQSSLYPSPTETVDMIHQCGGLAFLAHPYVYGAEFTARPEDWFSLGIDGVECLYGTFSTEEQQALVALCDRRKTYKSGGSDFHGLDIRPQNPIGLADGKAIPYTLIEPWLSSVEAKLI